MSLSTLHEECKNCKISNVRKRVLALVEAMISVLDDIVHRIGALEDEKNVKSMQLVVIFKQINDFCESNLPYVLRYQVQIKAELQRICKKLDEINKEKEMIIKTMAKFSTFLKVSSFTHSFLDIFESNLNILIEREKRLGSQISKIYQILCEMQAEYLYEIRKQNYNNTTAMVEMDPERIIYLIDELCKLKHFGKRFSLLIVYSKGSLLIDASSHFHPIPKPSPKSSKSKHQPSRKPKRSLKKTFINLISKCCFPH